MAAGLPHFSQQHEDAQQIFCSLSDQKTVATTATRNRPRSQNQQIHIGFYHLKLICDNTRPLKEKKKNLFAQSINTNAF